jgi:hypothetical protein
LKPHWRAILFFLPLAIVFGTPALALWIGGEFTSPDTVIARQIKDDRLVLHGPAYTNSASYVKTHLLTARRPQVLALGNSRVMQMRRSFFRPEVSFYNAGGIVARLRHFRAFLEELPPEALPKTLIIATDTSYFHPGFDKLERDALDVLWLKEQITTFTAPGEVYHNRWRDVWNGLRDGKIDVQRVLGGRGLSTRIGFSAVCREQGFRNDGSYLYGGIDLDISNPKHRDYQFATTLKQVAAGKGRFPWGATPSEPALHEVDLLLDFCRAHGIDVIGFMPPHPHAVWAAMQALGDKYAYIEKLEPALRERFDARGFEFYNFSDFAMLGAPDSEAIDGFHGSERTYLRLLIAMLERGSRLNAVTNLDELRAALAASTRHTSIFPELP